MMMLRLLVAMLLLGAGCSGSRNDTASRGDLPDAGVPDDFKIIAGSTGEVGGRMVGVTVTADGAVHRWEGKYVGEVTTPVDTLATSELNELWNRVREAGLLGTPEQQTGNRTKFLNVQAEGHSTRFTWAFETQDSLDVRNEVHRLVISMGRP